ncbi:quinone-dependent dihydroorotate dehydrogenase [Thiolinea disciformis]|uniref:quinone-dependent dihydroorotate dehydrogenase n=1 Tax=Thiolinea disciformis TaxID=125614 RepID=UPI00036BD76E|nr:quinone-dependent dihydroorotate dehydrogenase [Thiolinea disciformis]
MYSLIRPLLFALPPEASHNLALSALKVVSYLNTGEKSHAIPGQTVKVMGLDFPNPIGLAAGLDKNGDYIDALATAGFGFLEIGTITPRPQAGNPKPRLFRLPEHKAIINRMGFNNQGVDYLLKQVNRARYQGILGINIGKNVDTPVERAVHDYLLGLHKVYKYADYITINISSPNTPGLRSLQYGEELQQLLRRLKQEQKILADQTQRYVPLAVKLAPDLDQAAIQSMAQVILETQMDAVIATNTTLDKTVVATSKYGAEQGGLSGAPLTESSTRVIRAFHKALAGQVPIIGVGGIMTGADAQAKLEAGASLVQVYSGLIYRGLGLVKQCVKATNQAPEELG